jgi:hypothetical protein
VQTARIHEHEQYDGNRHCEVSIDSHDKKAREIAEDRNRRGVVSGSGVYALAAISQRAERAVVEVDAATEQAE